MTHDRINDEAAARLQERFASTLPAMPEPDLEDVDYELWGQNAKADVWFKERMRAYGLSCFQAGVAAERAKSEARPSAQSFEFALIDLRKAMETVDAFESVPVEIARLSHAARRVLAALSSKPPRPSPLGNQTESVGSKPEAADGGSGSGSSL